jgi:hypothetical protein
MTSCPTRRLDHIFSPRILEAGNSHKHKELVLSARAVVKIWKRLVARAPLRQFVSTSHGWPLRSHPVGYALRQNNLPDRLSSFFMRLSGVKFGKLNCSRIENGYAVQICIGNLHFMAECRRRSFFPFGSGPGSKVAQAPISARRIFLADDSALRWMTLLLVVETTRSRRH